MKLIAHRGLIEGPDPYLENRPEQIELTLAKGYDCEIDLWVKNQDLYLGHDFAQYTISKSFLEKKGLWIHAKNIDALSWLNKTNLNYFWHQNDFYTLTSHKFIWAYPGYIPTSSGVQVMPELEDPNLLNLDFTAYGICSDWILRIHSQRPKLL